MKASSSIEGGHKDSGGHDIGHADQDCCIESDVEVAVELLRADFPHAVCNGRDSFNEDILDTREHDHECGNRDAQKQRLPEVLATSCTEHDAHDKTDGGRRYHSAETFLDLLRAPVDLCQGRDLLDDPIHEHADRSEDDGISMGNGDTVQSICLLDGRSCQIGELQHNHLVYGISQNGKRDASGDDPDIGGSKRPYAVVEHVHVESVGELEKNHGDVHEQPDNQQDGIEAQRKEH